MKSLTHDENLLYLNSFEYRCALVSKAVYTRKDIGEYDLPFATEEQIYTLFGKTPPATDLADTVREQFYYDKRSERYILAFAGTNLLNPEDWANNIKQFWGLPTPYYRQGVRLMEAIPAVKRDQVVLTGHSLGGGVASVVAVACQMQGIVFNPPAIHSNTLAEFEAKIEKAQEKMQRFIVAGELLSVVNTVLTVKNIFAKSQYLFPGKTETLTGSLTLPLTSVVNPALFARKIIPVFGPILTVLGPLAEKSIKLHAMEEVLYGLRMLAKRRGKKKLNNESEC